MIFDTNKEKGRAGLSAAIAYFGMNGYTVSIPLNDTQDYDLVVEKDNIFQKVQCKFSGSYNHSGTQKVKLDTWGGAKGGTYYGNVRDSSCDLLFVLCNDKTMYLIPIKEITTKTQLTLLNFQKYQIDF